MNGNSTIVSYARYNQAKIEEERFNEVDSLILSWISYLHFSDEILPTCSADSSGKTKAYAHTFGTNSPNETAAYAANPKPTSANASCHIVDLLHRDHLAALIRDVRSPEETLELLYNVALNPRFRDILLCMRREEREHRVGKQFAAVTYQLRPDQIYVAYRGTDASLTGWEENFKMALKDPIPAQMLAAEYLNEVGSIFRGEIIVGGHSKGGNLAVYAAANCNPEVQGRITEIYSHDGPGFTKEELEKPGYQKIRSRIRKTAPQFSIFGMLLRQETEPKVIFSYEQGILQHSPLSWKTEGYGFSEYWYPDKVSQALKNKINNWLEGLSYEDRARFIDAVFDVLEETGATSLNEITRDPIRYVPVILRAIAGLDPEMQHFLMDLLDQFIKAPDWDRNGKCHTPDVTPPPIPHVDGSGHAPDMTRKDYSGYSQDIQDLMRKYDEMDQK